MPESSETRRWERSGTPFQITMIVVYLDQYLFFFQEGQPQFGLLELVCEVTSAVGSLLFAWCLWHLYVKRQRLTGLITSGLYRYTRHPMYLGLVLMNVGFWAPRNVWTSPLFLGLEAVFIISMLLAGYCQERETLERFGQPAADYYARTPRIPFTPW